MLKSDFVESFIDDAVSFGDNIYSWLDTPQEFFNTSIGSDFWIDGYDAFASTPRPILIIYIRRILDYIKYNDGKEDFNTYDLLSAFDLFVSDIQFLDESYLYPAIAAGLSCIHASEILLRENNKSFSIVNDSILILLSREYREIRFSGYNRGVAHIIIPKNDRAWFRPDLSAYGLQSPIVINGRPPKVQFYSAIHEIAHAVLFGDIYCRFIGTKKLMSSLLLNIEETVIGFDLLLYKSLSRFPKLKLHALNELQKISLGYEKSPMSRDVFLDCANDKLIWLQKRLKVFAQQKLNNDELISNFVIANGPKKGGINYWVSSDSINFHISGLKNIVDRVSDVNFQKIVSTIPSVNIHHENSFAALNNEFFMSNIFLKSEGINLSQESRIRSQLHISVKNLIIKSAELLYLKSKYHKFSNKFVSDVCGWAIKIQITNQENPQRINMALSNLIDIVNAAYPHVNISSYRKILGNSFSVIRDLE